MSALLRASSSRRRRRRRRREAPDTYEYDEDRDQYFLLPNVKNVRPEQPHLDKRKKEATDRRREEKLPFVTLGPNGWERHEGRHLHFVGGVTKWGAMPDSLRVGGGGGGVGGGGRGGAAPFQLCVCVAAIQPLAFFEIESFNENR